MRDLLIPLAAAVSTVAFAAPASAQWFPPQPQGYAYGYHNNYGYNHGHARALKARIDHMQRSIRHLAQRRMISRGEYRDLRRESLRVERRLIRDVRDGRGFSPREAYAAERRIARLERRIHHEVRDGRRYGYGYGW